MEGGRRDNNGVNEAQEGEGVTTGLLNRNKGIEVEAVVEDKSKETKVEVDDAVVDGGEKDVKEVSEKEEEDTLQMRTVWKLYLSRFLSAWGDRIWSFGLGIFLYKMKSENLRLIAAYGLIQNLVNLMLLTGVGHWIDKTGRLRAAKVLLVLQNSAVLLACVLLAVFFQYYDELVAVYLWLEVVLIVAVAVLALLANLVSHGLKIVVEKDWIVVIAGDSDARLARLNSNFRTIDLSCQTFGPIICGFVFSFAHPVVAASVIGAWNLVSVVLEYMLLQAIYKDFPKLEQKDGYGEDKKSKAAASNWLTSKVTGSVRGWVSYMTSDVRNAGLGLAFLYMTILGFDNITWGFCMQQCVEEWLLGVLVAVSGAVGIAGSRAFPCLRIKTGLERTGVIGGSMLMLALSACVVSVWLPGSPFDPLKEDSNYVNFASNVTGNASLIAAEIERHCAEHAVDMTSVSVLLTGIILARFGLWIIDLAVTQILQENVQVDKRGVIGGVQTSLNSLMDGIKFILVLVLPDPHTFGILILLSYIFISSGAMLLWSYAFKKRKLCCQKSYDPARTQEPIQEPVRTQEQVQEPAKIQEPPVEDPVV